MKILVEHATAECADRGTTPFFVYDNNSTQAQVKPQLMGIPAGQYLSIPANSPDLNKPVEHCFHQVKQKLLERLYTQAGHTLTPTMAQQWTLEAFQSIKLESLHKDIHSMPDTWGIVSTRRDVQFNTSRGEQVAGSQGNYPQSATYR